MKPTSYTPSTATLAIIVFGLGTSPVWGFYLICWIAGWRP